MNRSISYLSIAAALSAASPAMAQDSEELRQELQAMRAQMDAMAARMNALEQELEQVESEAQAANQQAVQAQQLAHSAQESTDNAGAKTKIAFKGAPEIKGENGWAFKPRGRLQYDAGFTAVPSSTGRDDGFGSEARRARLGVSGKMPGGFGYKFEVDFAGNDVAVTDALIKYKTGNVTLSAGQMNTFQSLEELTSSLHTSFIERAAFTDAFGFERRVGVAAELAKGDIRLQAGLFSDNMEDLSNKSWSADGRVVASPKSGKTQLHLGGSVHYAELESGDTVRYRQRPLVHFTSERFIDTGSFAAESELGLGLEAAVISGPFHAAAEAYWQNVNTPAGLADPTFFGGYGEVGYFLTGGDSRGYKSGKFDRTKPVKPVGEGGIGSVQLNLRYDYLDLSNNGLIGGEQSGYFASLVWKPTDYTMLLLNYGHLDYTNAVFPTASGGRDYGADTVAIRAQVDF